ncbi:MAG: NAD(P)H-dependent oxidoreductase subunit E [Pseudomonadota bacterium]
MSYTKHVFFCTNTREDGTSCCNRYNSQKMRKYAKDKAKQLGIHGDGKIRINSAGCLGKCDQGPVIVVYPEAVWYTWIDEVDIDEILTSHLVDGKPVERLRIK